MVALRALSWAPSATRGRWRLAMAGAPRRDAVLTLTRKRRNRDQPEKLAWPLLGGK